MRTRTAVPLALVLTGLVALPAPAAPKRQRVCHLVLDERNDVYLLRNASGATTPDPALDIVSADLATNGKTLTAAIRVVRYTSPASTSPSGSNYEVQFRITGSNDLFYLSASQVTSAGPTYDVGYRQAAVVTTVATSLGTASGVFDAAKNEIRISAPLSVFAGRATFKAGATKLFEPAAYTSRGARGRGVFADHTTAGKAYVVGTPSCVPVGK